MPSSTAGSAQLMRKALRTPDRAATTAPRRAVKVNPEGIVRAIVSVTGVVDAVNDLIVPGGFAVTLKKRRPKVVDDHEWGKKAGRVLHIEEWMPGDKRLPQRTKDGQPWPLEAGALVATIQYNLDIDSGRDSFGWVKFYADSNEAEFSIGYKVPPGKARKRHDGVRVILEVDLFELSHVLFGAAPLSMALEVKSLHGATGGDVTVPALGDDEEVEPMEPEYPWETPKKGTRARLEAKSAAAVLADALGVPALEVKQAKMRGSYEERTRLIEAAALDVLNTDSGACYAWVCPVATYDHEVVVTAYPHGDCGCPEASFVIPYTYDPVRGTVALDVAQPVELTLTAGVPKERPEHEDPHAEATDEPEAADKPFKPFDTTLRMLESMWKVEGKAADAARARVMALAGMETKGADGEVYSIDHLPDGDFELYSKTEPIEAIRLDGPFTVETREGRVTTDDGWLALDSGGYPYPIAADEFDQVYAPYDETVEAPSPTDDLETKQPAPAAPAPADEPEEAETDPEERVTIDADAHFADMAELHADDDPEDDEAA